MPQQSSASTPNSQQDAGFVPRKEFIREQKPAPNVFAILAIASSSFIRLYSFPQNLVTALRRLLEHQSVLLAFREDVQQNLCEFTLDGKPWANAKSVKSEKLLVDILSVIFQCGYSYLSTLDYGRENDDRLAMAFSKPSTSSPGSRAGTPLPASVRESIGSVSSEKPRSRKVPFALSFASATVMRVIAPPLHLTPAVLQAVRGSWPRGVVSEKKVGENSFEFRLKGYKWFQQDTFATDSLRYILTLLSSLDAQSFTLLASISLTNRSRVKDLWIFTAPAPSSTEDLMRQESPATSFLNSSHGEIKRRLHGPEVSTFNTLGPGQTSVNQHRRLATDPNVSLSQPPPFQHIRAATEDGHNVQFTSGDRHENFATSSPSPMTSSPGLLRKPAPRAQVPVSVIHEVDPSEMEVIRANLPSMVSSNAENMTGVGTARFSPDVFYATTPFGGTGSGGRSVPPIAPAPVHAFKRERPTTPPNRTRSSLRPVSTRSKTPPLLVSNPPSPSASPPRNSPYFSEQRDTVAPIVNASTVTPPLLGAGAFRDSAFSSSTDASCEIPVKWTGIGDRFTQNPVQSQEQNGRPQNKRASSGPMLPGGWQPTPIEERPEEGGSSITSHPTSEEKAGVQTPIHEVSSRISSPELTHPDGRLRKSEAALVDMIAETSQPPLPQPTHSRAVDSPSSGSGQGWVLVNVESTASPSPAGHPVSDGRHISQAPQPLHNTNIPQQTPDQTASPQAKAIVIMDAMDANKQKAKLNEDGSPGKKRFFGLVRKGSKKVPTSASGESASNENISTKPRSGLRDKLRLIGTPEAPRNEQKRRSID
ncbi:hypothetical protein Hypma_015348 [Hypsizygus marmoreus]|uniref:Uncharacterized protein n=1 Tax=Hypsizygus marmoreus TaxID=39966 RepID=A0A369K5Z3_HYPMA|nr:hypothetical protein Hypma_015348 [Hypsizygus marmoreus]